MKIRYLLIASLIFLITSCAVSQGEMITRKHKRVKRMSDAKLYKKVVENYLDFNNINFKKVSITYEEDGKKQEFRGSARILKDSIIWLSLSKLGIEGVRVKLTPDSVTLIDRLHRKYLFTDYLYLNEKLNLELNFDIIQSFLTNQLFNYRTLFKDTAFHRNFKGKRTKTHYVFYSKRRKSRKYWKQQSNLTGNTGNTLEILRISPDLMRLENVIVYDTQFFKNGGKQSVHFNLEYEDYKKYDEKHLFPEKIRITVQKELKENATTQEKKATKTILTIKVNRLQVNQENLNFPFSINKKYKPIDE